MYKILCLTCTPLASVTNLIARCNNIVSAKFTIDFFWGDRLFAIDFLSYLLMFFWTEEWYFVTKIVLTYCEKKLI